jgi:cytochrome c biogenesis protein CcmG/thiol:disulfide interchange protein DsbE
LPLVLFLALAAMFFFRLHAGDPAAIPSVLIGRPVPETQLPPLADSEQNGAGVPGITPGSFQGEVTVLNVWASWCVPCRDEAPLLHQMAQDKRIKIVGVNYKDDAENAKRFLARYGNPFTAIGVDANGRASIEWGVYGVPETFLIGRDGRIAFKLIGPITQENLIQQFRPAIEKALAAPAS